MAKGAGRDNVRRRQHAVLRAHEVEWLPAPPPPPEVAAIGYHGPTGDTADAEAVELVRKLAELREQYERNICNDDRGATTKD